MEEKFDYNSISEEPEGLDYNNLTPCLHCKKPIPCNATLCLYCGESVSGSSKEKKNNWIIVVVVIILIIALVSIF